MVKFSAKEKKQAEDIISHGMWNFVLVRGVLYFGGIMFLFMTLFNFVIYGSEIIDESYLRFNIVLWAMAGLIFGFVCWFLMCKRVKQK